MDELFDQITTWMNANGAEENAANLAPGASAERIKAARERLGFEVPEGLETLWHLHDGQREEGNPFWQRFDLFGTERALAERDRLLRALASLREIDRDRVCLAEEELETDAWVPVAGGDGEFLAACALTGNVYFFPKADTPSFVATSIECWLDDYAAAVELDDYEVEEGFGGTYLALRDREAEARNAEARARLEAKEHYRRTTPLRKQLADALAGLPATLQAKEPLLAQKIISDECAAVMEAVASRSPSTLDQSARAVVRAGPYPEFIALTLRPLLSQLTLEAEEWLWVAEGGMLLGNHAVRDVALQKAREAAAGPELFRRLLSAETDSARRERLAALVSRLWSA